MGIHVLDSPAVHERSRVPTPARRCQRRPVPAQRLYAAARRDQLRKRPMHGDVCVAAAELARLLPARGDVWCRTGPVRRCVERKPAVSTSLALGFKAPALWPLCVASEGRNKPLALAPGDMLIYRGADVPHWREPFTGEYRVQTFLHYVDAHGSYTDSSTTAASASAPSTSSPCNGIFGGRRALGSSTRRRPWVRMRPAPAAAGYVSAIAMVNMADNNGCRARWDYLSVSNSHRKCVSFPLTFLRSRRKLCDRPRSSAVALSFNITHSVRCSRK